MASKAPALAHPVFDRLRATTGLSDRQLALRIGMDTKGPYDCRRTGAVPYRHLVQAVQAGAIACDLHWLLTGQPAHPEARA
ncbi:MAG TPA: hypothetical protein PKY40_12080 [Burkholderiaceae bacterium]|nr:hypothetical protein [Burkholderiaceae bacterium]